MGFPPKLPSFRVLEESIRNFGNERPCRKSQLCRSPTSNPPSAKKRRMNPMVQESVDAEQNMSDFQLRHRYGRKEQKPLNINSFVSMRHPVLQRKAFRHTHVSVVEDPQHRTTHFKRIRIQDIINPVVESTPIVYPIHSVAVHATHNGEHYGEMSSPTMQDHGQSQNPFLSIFHSQIHAPGGETNQEKTELHNNTSSQPSAAVNTYAVDHSKKIPARLPISFGVLKAKRHSFNDGANDVIRMYDLEKLRRLKCKVVNGRIYNEQNYPICGAPRENGSPCTRNITRSSCKWHGDIKILNSSNTKNGQLDAFGNFVTTSRTKEGRSIATGSTENQAMNQQSPRTAVNQSSRKQSKVLRWNNEEHFWFLLGYERLGKKWSLISKIVKTRTTLQVQSHAQKYFDRRNNDEKKKSTIHDLTLESAEMQSIAAGISAEAKEARLKLAKS